MNSTSSLACKASHSTALLLSRHPPSSLLLTMVFICLLGFLNIDHSTDWTLLSSCQLSSETSSNHFLSVDILSGRGRFLCGIQILCLYLRLISNHFPQRFLSYFCPLLPSAMQYIRWDFCRNPQYLLHPRQLQYCTHYFVERSAAIIGRPARVIGSISQKVITLPDGVITTYFLQLLDCLCYLSAINSMNTFIIWNGCSITGWKWQVTK